MTTRRALAIAAVACLATMLLCAGDGPRVEARAGEANEPEPLSDMMSRVLEDVQGIVTHLALADRAKVQEKGNELANEALRIASVAPKKQPEEIGTYRYLAYRMHVNAREVASARSPKIAQEKLGDVLGSCVDCHYIFRD